ncbi:MAG: hypothetical protein HOP19_20825 [Acidobacteria bacterium]|nr:hypothetical protein [Acidobacteriota bacterium]
MKKQAKPKSNRTQVKDLKVEQQQELTADKTNKIRGGTSLTPAEIKLLNQKLSKPLNRV